MKFTTPTRPPHNFDGENISGIFDLQNPFGLDTSCQLTLSTYSTTEYRPILIKCSIFNKDRLWRGLFQLNLTTVNLGGTDILELRKNDGSNDLIVAKTTWPASTINETFTNTFPLGAKQVDIEFHLLLDNLTRIYLDNNILFESNTFTMNMHSNLYFNWSYSTVLGYERMLLKRLQRTI